MLDSYTAEIPLCVGGSECDLVRITQKQVTDRGIWTMNWPPVSLVQMGSVGMHLTAVWKQELAFSSFCLSLNQTFGNMIHLQNR